MNETHPKTHLLLFLTRLLPNDHQCATESTVDSNSMPTTHTLPPTPHRAFVRFAPTSLIDISDRGVVLLLLIAAALANTNSQQALAQCARFTRTEPV